MPTGNPPTPPSIPPMPLPTGNAPRNSPACVTTCRIWYPPVVDISALPPPGPANAKPPGI
jgi:hypothetical protein